MSQEAGTTTVNDTPQFQAIVPGANQTVTVVSSSTPSAAFAASTTLARFYATTDCFLAFGASPTATTGGLFLPAGQIEYFGVTPGQKVATIQSSASGTCYVTEGA